MDGKLLIPMAGADGQLVGLQKIDAAGVKLYNKGADLIGAAHILGQLAGAAIIGIGEGYATCRTVRMVPKASDIPVVVAFTAGNLLAVALWLRHQYPAAHLLFLVDDDYQMTHRFIERLREEFKVSAPVPIDGNTHQVIGDDGEPVAVMAIWRKDACGIDYIEADVRKGRLVRMLTFKNAGLACCTAAAAKVGNASLAMPAFIARGDNKWTDFNDLHVEESLDSVAAQIGFAIHAAQQPVIDPPLSLSAQSADPGVPISLRELDEVDPPPPSAKQPANRDFDGAESDAARFSDFDGGASDSGDIFPKGEGDGGKGRKEKPKKVYGDEHWNQVNYVLQNFILIYGEDLVWNCSQRMLMKISSMRTIVQNNDVMKFWGGEARKWVLKKTLFSIRRKRPVRRKADPRPR